MAEGIFHDAHEVYSRGNPVDGWVWLATFANKPMAESYAAQLVEFANAIVEVRPV